MSTLHFVVRLGEGYKERRGGNEKRRGKQTSIHPQYLDFLKIIIINGAPTALPTRHAAPNFHAFSRSLVRAYTLSIKNRMYTLLRM